MLDVEFAELSDAGVIRSHNEDSLGHVAPRSPDEARTHGWLFAIADGVGGQDRGEVASRLAIETLLSGFQTITPAEPLTGVLPRLVQAANTRIFETAMATGPGGSSMATTVVACALRYDRAVVSHVGDSRCYLVRQGYAVPLTRDHTFSNEQLRMGLVTSREAEASQASHVLSRALGSEMFISVETGEHQVFPDDVLVLCSDGLHHSVSATDLVHLTGQSGLEQTLQDLIGLAKQRDGTDNISAQIVRIRSVERVGLYRGRHYPLQ